MTRTTKDTATGPSTPQRDETDVFAALVHALADQLDAARRGRLDWVVESMERADALLEQVRAGDEAPSPACRRTLRHLHEQVRLCLAQQQEELVRRRRQLAQGKGTLRAYRQAGDAGQGATG